MLPSNEPNYDWFHMLWFIVLIPIGIFVLVRGRRWWKKKRALDHVNSQYESLRETRADVVYHYHWAREKGEDKSARIHEEHVMEIDGKLLDLKDKYMAVESEEMNYNDILLEMENSADEDKMGKSKKL